MKNHPYRTKEEYYKWEVLLDHNLSKSEKLIMYYFCHFEDYELGKTLAEISEDLSMSVACVSKNIGSLVYDGYLRKLRDVKKKTPVYEATLSGHAGKGSIWGRS